MSAITSTIPEYLNELRTQLIARPGMLDVNVWTALMPDPDCGPKCIQFESVSSNKEWGALGAGRRNETYTITGFIRIVESGAGEETSVDAREEVFRILREMDLQLRDKQYGGLPIQSVALKSVEMRAYPSAQERVCAVFFDIEVKASFTTV